MPATSAPPFDAVITVTLNTAIDRIIETPGLAVGAHLVGRRIARQPTGKGVNVSRALAALGVESIATGFVGEDELAAFEKLGDDRRIRPQFLAVPGQTRENITLIDPEHGAETHVRTEGPAVTERDVDRLRRKLNLIAKPGTLVVFAGSLPPGMQAADAVGLIEQAASAGAAIALDCAPVAMAAVMHHPLWLAKCNRAEFAEILGEPLPDEDALMAAGRQVSAGGQVGSAGKGPTKAAAEPPADADAAESFAATDAAEPSTGGKAREPSAGTAASIPSARADASGPSASAAGRRSDAGASQTWIVTCGAAGAYAFTDGAALMAQVDVDADAVVSTVGCGDALLAGYIAARQNGHAVSDAFARATAVATASALSAVPGQFRPVDVDKFTARTSILSLT